MTSSYLEHVNITVSDAGKMADMLCELFDWRVRWQGEAIRFYETRGLIAPSRNTGGQRRFRP